MFYHNIDPVLLKIGVFEIRYYGLIFVIGIILAYYLTIYLVRRKKLNISDGDLTDLFFYMVVGIIIGSRLVYVIVYNLGFFISNPLKIFFIWEGGLSFHGGLLGAAFSGYWFLKKKKIRFYDLADIVVIPP
jgi:phosphatidylglycerol:prolipoprotein diacylglycerol transferase